MLGGDDLPPQLPDVAEAVRHPDMSVVVDLSHVAQSEKVKYIYTLLPMLSAIQRKGFPHRIVVDEAHYFLHESNVRDLLDLDLDAYTLLTYHLSNLHTDVRKAVGVLIVKRISDRQEVETLMRMVMPGGVKSEWTTILEKLTIDHAALLPDASEAGGELRRFELFRRVTSHVRQGQVSRRSADRGASLCLFGRGRQPSGPWRAH